MPVHMQPDAVSMDSPHNLWNKALNTLGAELRDSLNLTKLRHGEVLNRALREAQEKKQICVQNCWTFKKRNGQTIILRDVVEKIVVWVEKFISIGDAAMQYDPGHAALAWAAFRFVLQMAVNDKKAFGEMVENLETVSHLITRYAILEELYLQRYSAARDKLEDVVVHLYVEILTFLAKARQYFQTSAKIRLATSIIKFDGDEHMAKINVLDGQISRLSEILAIDVQTDTAKEVGALKALLLSLNEPIKRLVDSSSISAKVLQESQRLQLLHWLSPVQFSVHHARHSESRIPGSGRWLLDNSRYLDWRNSSSSSIFLLHGILGSGKTSLASAVIDSFLQESSGEASSAPLTYFYCTKSPAEPERRDPEEIIRSVLRQLTISKISSITSTVHERVFRKYEFLQEMAKVDGFEIARLKAAECVRLILDTTVANPAIIVLDAVDEIDPSSRHVLLSALNQIVQDSLNVVKIFVTSRDDPNIHSMLPNAIALRVEKLHNCKDMEKFVHQEISSAIQNRRLLNGVVSHNLREDLISVLITRAGEMFVWVVRQLENISRLKTEADIRNTIWSLPEKTLSELYEEDFTQISRSGHYTRKYAFQVFSMLLCAREPLSPEALIQMIAKSTSQQGETVTFTRMIDMCMNLVVLDFELHVLRFAHISFQEFLESKAEFAPQLIHRVAAEYCLEFCIEGLLTGMKTDISPKNDFHLYSAIYWAEHCRNTNDDKANNSINSKMREFVFDEDGIALSFIDWNQQVGKLVDNLPIDHPLAKGLNSAKDSGGSPLFTACVFGLVAIMKDLSLVTDYDWNRSNDLGQSGLYLAAATGQETAVKSLLQHPVDINALGGKLGLPIHAACFGGHISVVKILLDHGANPKIGSKSALEYSLLAGKENIALLLLTDIFRISDQAEYDSILQQSAEAGFTTVIDFLQKEYASLYGVLESARCRAVEVPIFRGRLGVVERHIQRLNNPKIDLPADAIATAALGGQDTMILLLVEQGLELQNEGVFGTPLRAACIMCHESTVRLLLKLGASPHDSGSLGEPLQAAAMQGHISIIRILLNSGANVNNRGGLYGNALQAAAYRGHPKAVEILLDAGADVHQKGMSRDVFHPASEGGYEGVVRLLLDKGVKVTHPVSTRLAYMYPAMTYKDILRNSSPSQHHEVKPIRDHQPEPKGWHQQASTTNVSYMTETMRGVMNPLLETVEAHRERFWYPEDETPNYALRAAAAKGHVEVIELLLSHLEAMDISNHEVVAAFKAACENGQIGVVSKFLSGLIKLEAEDLEVGLEAAALNGQLPVVNLLVHYEDRHELARLNNDDNSRPARGRSRNRIPPTSTQETLEYDSTAWMLLNAGSKAGHLSVLRRGQSLVAQRCPAIISRHLYGKALITAATSCKLDVLTALLEKDFDFNLVELTEVLISVCAWGSVEALHLLLRHDETKVLGIEQYSRGLKEAAQMGKRQVVLYLLEECPECQHLVVEPETVIDAAANDFMDILPLLIQRIRPMDVFEKTLNQGLQVASRNGHQKVVEYLIGKGADINTAVEVEPYISGYNNAWVRNRRKGLPKLTSLQAALIGPKRSKSETVSGCGLGYLQYSRSEAHASSQQRTIEILLAKGADPNEAAEYQRYPLNIAAEYGTVESVQALISSGAHADAVTKKDGTALEVAAGRELGSFPVIKTFLEANQLASSADLGKIAALNKALSYFGGSGLNYSQHRHRFKDSNSVAEVLNNGAGAAVKTLLEHLPKQKADDSSYSHLAQMACVAGDQECVEILLRHSMDVNCTGYYYGTALQAACRVGNITMVECLLNSGADINILRGAHSTALRAATLGGHEELIRKLIGHGADVNLRYKDKDKSILHLALEARNLVIFKILLAAGADIDVETPGQQPILIAACKYGETTLIEVLLAGGADVNTLGIYPEYCGNMLAEAATPLHAACSEGHFSAVQLLLDHEADIEKTNESAPTPLITTIRKNNLSIINLLLDAGADVNHAIDTSPLSEAAEDCKLEILQVLLSAGAIIGGPSIKVNALTRACQCSQHMAAELLLEALSGTQYEAEICSEALSAALKWGDDKTVCLLLDFGATPTFETLRQACSAGFMPALKMLVNMGFDVNEDDGEDNPLLNVAACHTRSDVVEFLIDRGADVNLRSTKYGSPLSAVMEGIMAPLLRSRRRRPSCQSLAMQLPLPEPLHPIYVGNSKQISPKPWYKEISRCEQIVRCLLDAGAKIDTSIRSFGNALHLASYMGSVVIVRQLLEKTENVNIIGGYFASPLLAALDGGHERIVELLLDWKIDPNATSPEHGSAIHFAGGHRSEEMVRKLLNHGADINAHDGESGSALAAAAKKISFPSERKEPSERQHAVVDLLLHHEPKVQIRECDLIAAASWGDSTDNENSFMRAFLQHDPSVVATEKVILEILQNIAPYHAVGDILPLLLERDGGLGTTPAMLEATKNVAAMKMLLKHKPTCQMTSSILESASQRSSYALELLSLLLRHDPKAHITEAVVKAVLESRASVQSKESVMTLLLDRDPNFKITDSLLEAATDTRHMELLLDRRTEDQTISSELLGTVVKHYSGGGKLASLLLKHDRSVKVRSAVVRSAMYCQGDTESFFTTLFVRDPAFDMTPDDLIALVQIAGPGREESRRKILNILLEFQKTNEFTAEVREALDDEFSSTGDKDIKEKFYQLERR